MNIFYYISYKLLVAYKVGLWIILTCLTLVAQASSPEIVLKPGLVIKKSATIKAGVYKLMPISKEGEVITIEGNDITVDFNGAVLQGFQKPMLPDAYAGIGVRIKGHNVVIKNAVIKGYKIGIIATDCEDLHITQCDLSYNYKQALQTNISLANTLKEHRFPTNQNDEWIQYGAGIYLRNCAFAEVDHCTTTGGQNGLVLSECNNGTFWNNKCTFLTGFGIALYRSTNNEIMHNQLDWCVNTNPNTVDEQKPYAASIFLYEQSAENTIAHNSATHSQVGILMLGNQQQTDNEEEGCNDNLIYNNDVSYASQNGIEVYFIRTKIINNRLEECVLGIKGVNLHNSLLLGNQFKATHYAIHLESSQENSIIYNTFEKDSTAIRLAGIQTNAINKAHTQNSEAQSREYFITNNTFNNTATPLQFYATKGIYIEENNFSTFNKLLLIDSSATELQFTANNLHGFDPKTLQNKEIDVYFKNTNNYLAATTGKLKSAPSPFTDTDSKELIKTILEEETIDTLENGLKSLITSNPYKGRKYMIVDEWGPYDFKSPLLLLRKEEGETNWTFEIMGPAGKWKLKNSKGITLGTTSGAVPGKIQTTVSENVVGDIEIELEYIGSTIITPAGETIQAGKPYIFRYKQLAKPLTWTLKK